MNNKRLAAWSAYARRHPNTVVALLFLLVLFVCFQPLFLGHATIKWDAFRLWLPWKHFIVEELANGKLPLWNPFMNHGFPQHGDTMTWYPISWIIGFFYGNYNLSALNTEYLFHLFIAGFGFYTFSATFNCSKRLRFLMGLSYMLSGLMIGNAQHMAWIISAAWLPWYFLTLSALLEKTTLIHFLRFSLVGFLLFSGGYLAMFFVVIYCSVVFVSWKIYKQSELKRRWISAGMMALSIGVIALLSAPLLYSVYDIFPLFNRFDPATAIDINLGGTPLIGVLAIVLPLASGVFNVPEFEFGTFSTFIGSIPILLIICSITRRNASQKAVALTGIALFFLLLSLSDYLPFRNWIGQLPLLNLFRYPSLFRLFFIFFALWALGEIFKKNPIDKMLQFHPRWWLIGGLAFSVIAVCCLYFSGEENFGDALNGLLTANTRNTVDVWFRGGINALLGIVVSIAIFFLVSNHSRLIPTIISFLWAGELMFVANLAAPHVIYEPINLSFANDILEFQPKTTPPILSNHKELERNEWRGYVEFGWEGKTNFFKQFSGLWFNPLSLKPGSVESEISISEENPLFGIVGHSGNLIDLFSTVHIHDNQHWTVSVSPDLIGDSNYFYIKQRLIPNWYLPSGEKLISSKEGFILVPLKQLIPSFELRFENTNYKRLFVVFLIVFSLVLLFIIVLSRHWWKYVLAGLVIAVVSFYHWDIRSPILDDSTQFSTLQESDSNNFILASFWEKLPNNIAIPADYTLSDHFIQSISYHYPNKQYSIVQSGGAKWHILNKVQYDRKPVFQVDTAQFIQQGLSIDLTAEISRYPLKNSAPYLEMEYTASSETTAKLWFVHATGETWIDGFAIDLSSIFTANTSKRVIRRIDLSRFQPRLNETIKLYIWGEGDYSDVTVSRIEIRE